MAGFGGSSNGLIRREKPAATCGKQLYRNNRSHMCTACQRKWGLETLRRRNKPLQKWHLSVCRDQNCEDPAHWADYVPVHPRKPKRPSRANVQPGNSLGPIYHTVLLNCVTSKWLDARARALSAERGCRIAKTDLIRQAIEEYLQNHPDCEFFEDAVPGSDTGRSR